jgi:hypothetical protein
VLREDWGQCVMVDNKLSLLLKLSRKVRHYSEIVLDRPGGDLEGMCGKVSKYLALLAGAYGMRITLREGGFGAERYSHTWVEYYGKIIDLTATQFGETEPVLISSVYSSKYGKASGHRNHVDRFPFKKRWHEDYLALDDARLIHRKLGEPGSFLYKDLHHCMVPMVYALRLSGN